MHNLCVRLKSLSLVIIIMGRFAKAPLINLLYGAAATGEAIVRLSLGDFEGAADSLWASIYNVVIGLTSYIPEDPGRQNLVGGLNVLLCELRRRYKPTSSITYAGLPWIGLFQSGANLSEYGLRKILKRYQRK